MTRLIEFEFAPIETLRGAGSQLSWYELSDGYFQFNTEPERLMVYSDAFLDRYAAAEGIRLRPQVQYYIARLWEDVAGAYPDLMDPVPSSIVERVAPYLGAWRDWQDRTEAFLERTPEIDQDSERVTHFLELANGWYQQLDAGYLKAPPGIIGWSDETHVHVQWDNRDAVEEGVPVWQAGAGHYTIAKDAFFEDLKAFHRSFMAGMANRIDAASQLPADRGVVVDTPALFAEQRERTALLDMAVSRSPKRSSATWQEIADVVARICDSDTAS